MVTRLDVIQPAVLRWARETAHLPVDEAARRAGVTARGLAMWEGGEQAPTVIQLRKLAAAYNRPLGALFLPQPPADEVVPELPDFRRGEVQGRESAGLRRAILAARTRLETVDDLADEGLELPFGSGRLELDRLGNPEAEGDKLRQYLKLESLSSRAKSPSELLQSLIEILSASGYLIMQVQRVDYGEMRGFSILGRYASVAVLNASDYPRGKVFTLLHEMVHLSLRSGALCDLSRRNGAKVERFCDAVAAAALMPATTMRAVGKGVDPSDYDSLRALGDEFGPGPSAESVLLRMVTLGMATWDTYNSLRTEFRQAYDDHREEVKPQPGEDPPPIYYPLKVRDLGKPFISMITQAHEDGLVSSRDVAELLDISYGNLPKLLNQARFGRLS